MTVVAQAGVVINLGPFRGPCFEIIEALRGAALELLAETMLSTWTASGPYFWATLAPLWASSGYSCLHVLATWLSGQKVATPVI